MIARSFSFVFHFFTAHHFHSFKLSPVFTLSFFSHSSNCWSDLVFIHSFFKMFTSITFLLSASIATLSLTANASPTPFHHVRAVTELNKEATAEAHTRDAGATRAFEGVEIKVCLIELWLWTWLMIVDFGWKVSVCRRVVRGFQGESYTDSDRCL